MNIIKSMLAFMVTFFSVAFSLSVGWHAGKIFAYFLWS